MTREEIMRLEGRALDAAVAEYVMGWVREGGLLLPPEGSEMRSWAAEWDENGLPSYLPGYSVGIAPVWDVVERMREQGWSMQMYQWQDGTPTVRFFKHRGGGDWVRGRNSAEAICRAALLAVCGEAGDDG